MYENLFKTSMTLISFKINRNLKWLLSFLLPKSVQIQLIHWKNNNFYFQLYKVCVVTVPYCMNCVLTVLCWSLYFQIFLFFCCYGTVVSCNSEVQCHTLVFSPSAPPKPGFQSFRTSITRFLALPNLQNQVFSPSEPPNQGFQFFRTSITRFSVLPHLQTRFLALPNLHNQVFSPSEPQKPNLSPFGSSMTRVSAVPTSRIVYVQPRFHVHDLNHEYFMYIRVFMNMIWITNTLCRTVLSCTWPELRIVYVQPRFHVQDLNCWYFMYSRVIMYITKIKNFSCT